MHDEATFLQAMQERPDDTALRLVFADWLDERGDPRGEFLRLLHTLTQTVEVPQRKELESRLRKLMASGIQPVGPFLINSIGMTFAWIPAGTFLMGSNPKEHKRQLFDETQHKVTLTKGFYLAIHPVTQAAWKKLMQNNPSDDKEEDHPVTNVSWHDCQKFLKKLTEKEGQSYRLPTEAEWEYACRAGTTTAFFFGRTISSKQAKSPNALGLYVPGPVVEWCSDWYGPYWRATYIAGQVIDPEGPPEGTVRVLRGGYQTTPKRSASRYFRFRPTESCDYAGFRPAMTFTPKDNFDAHRKSATKGRARKPRKDRS